MILHRLAFVIAALVHFPWLPEERACFSLISALSKSPTMSWLEHGRGSKVRRAVYFRNLLGLIAN